MDRLVVRSVLLLLIVLNIVSAQESHQHRPTTGVVIDGSVHPELVPDNAAYRLYFVTIAAMPPDVRKAQFMSAGLSREESSAAITAVDDFKAKWQAVRSDYNRRVQAHLPYNRQLFLAERDKLVADLLAELQAHITATGFSKLHTHIQGEKVRMKLGADAR